MDSKKLNQAAFSRLMGVNKATVSKWVAKGRVLVVDGLIDVEAAKQRLAATENPMPQAQAQIARHASVRAAKPVQAPQRVFEDVDTLVDPAQMDENATESESDELDGIKLAGRKLKMATLRLQESKAELASIEVDKAAGLLVERAEIDYVLADHGNALRSKLLGLADRLAPAIAVHRGDVSAIHAEIEGVAMNILNEITDDLSRKMEGI